MDVPDRTIVPKKVNAPSSEYSRYLQSFQFDKTHLLERPQTQYINTDKDNDSTNTNEYYAYEKQHKGKFTHKKRTRVDKESSSHKQYLIRIPLDSLLDDNDKLCSETEIKPTT